MGDSAADLEARLVAIEGVTAGPSRLGSTRGFFVRGKEFAHFHEDDEIDVRLPPAQQREFMTLDPVRPRPHRSPWIAVRLESEADVEIALDMLALAIETQVKEDSR